MASACESILFFARSSRTFRSKDSTLHGMKRTGGSAAAAAG
jgi:hypothetical protein